MKMFFGRKIDQVRSGGNMGAGDMSAGVTS